jgi:uncharacterized membrane protein
MGLWRHLKPSFWRGLAALLPALLSLIVLLLGVKLVYENAGIYVNWVIVRLAALILSQDHDDVAKWYDDHYMNFLGVVLAVIGLCVIAYLVGAFLGARITKFLEGWIMHVPLMRRIYPGAKQVSEFFFSDRKVEFRRVVAVEFPRRGMWMLGFVTGRAFAALSAKTGSEMVSVFIPSTPAPITGYVVSLAKEDVVDLPITVDEAIQYLISAGVIMPPAERSQSLEVIRQIHEVSDPPASGAKNP